MGRPFLLAAAVLALALPACRQEPVAIPAEPKALVRVERYGFGDSWNSQDTRAWIQAMDRIEPRLGRVRLGIRELPATVAPEALRAELQARLVPAGWTPIPELTDWRGRGSYAFGWEKDGRVYALVGLKHRPAELNRSPVNILTNMVPDGQAV